MSSIGHVWFYKAWCSAVIGCFSTALIGAFRSLLFHWVICSLGGPLCMAFLLLCFFVFFLFRDSPLVDGKENKSFEFSEWTVKVQLYEICDSVSTSISFITPPLTFGKLKNIDIAAGKVSAQPHTIVKQICFPNGDVSFFSLFSLFKNWMYNVGWGCADILPYCVLSRYCLFYALCKRSLGQHWCTLRLL